MKIYVAHSRSLEDYQNTLYKPIAQAVLGKWKHEVTFPHIDDSVIRSQELIRKCDLVIAEVSEPSIGLGIELGWADIYGTDVCYFCRTNVKIPISVAIIASSQFHRNTYGRSTNMYFYYSTGNLQEQFSEIISLMEKD